MHVLSRLLHVEGMGIVLYCIVSLLTKSEGLENTKQNSIHQTGPMYKQIRLQNKENMRNKINTTQ